MTRRDDYDDMRKKGLAPHLSYPVKIVGAIILISVALIGLSALLTAAAGGGGEGTTATEEPTIDIDEHDLVTREYVISEVVTGYSRLALEYGIHLDGDVFKDMLIDSDFLMGEELAGAQLAGWMSSPEDIASEYKQRILDEGQVPKEVMQKLYEQVEDYKAKRG